MKATDIMIVTAFRSGQVSYGLRIKRPDRDRFFKRKWKTVNLSLSGHSGPIEVNIDKGSFWEKCVGELINKEIKRWLFVKDLAPWPPHEPPKIYMYQISEGYFSILLPVKG